MKQTKNKIVLIVLILIIMLLIPQTTKAGVLQANPTTNGAPTKQQGQYWIATVRNMELTGQAMGLDETIDATTKLGTTTSNGIDVHMMKSTEYGALAILSASGFGNPANTTTIDTTTGNKTGVYMQKANYEWVAGAGSAASEISGSIAHRYFNTYGSVKPGDALDLKWHSPGASLWLSSNYCAFYRGGSYGVFGYYSNYNNPNYNSYASRAVVVSGTGF